MRDEISDRDAFIPGLKPRGHESVLYATTRELLASLPTPAEAPDDEHASFARLRHDPLEAMQSDQELARAFVHRHGHRSES